MTSDTLASSVIAVPPLARDEALALDASENARVVRHLESGGVRTLLYGGNAALAHVALSEYAELLGLLVDATADTTTVIPSVGPQYGMMMDQADVLRDHDFPTVMLLPSRDGHTPAGLASGIARFVDKFGRPIVLYIKHDGMIDVQTVEQLHRDGLISWIKYAIVREDPEQDPFLSRLLDAIGTGCVVSGIGEQPALAHLRDFGLTSFTSGCVCVAPALSMTMLSALKQADFATAEQIRRQFAPLEALRDEINPVRVLHAAVRLSGIANTGPITAFWSAVSPQQEQAIESVVRELQSTTAMWPTQ